MKTGGITHNKGKEEETLLIYCYFYNIKFTQCSFRTDCKLTANRCYKELLLFSHISQKLHNW